MAFEFHRRKRRPRARLEAGGGWAGPAVGLGLLLLAGSARAAFDAYLFLPGVPGSASETNHLDWIPILSFEHSQRFPPGTARVQFLDLTLVKPVDQASPLLVRACAGADRFQNARLQLVHLDARRLVFYDVHLSNVWVTAVAPSQSASNLPPSESLSLSFSHITWTYTGFNASGLPSTVVQSYWDLLRNVGGSSVVPAFRITGLQPGPGNATVSWDATGGKTYRLFASPLVQGPYAFAAQQTTSSNGTASVTVRSPGSLQFYWMEQLP